MITLTLKRTPTVPLEAEVISPDQLGQLSHSEICASRIIHGKRQCRIDDFFDVQGERSLALRLQGDLTKVRWIGRAMSLGSIEIDGPVGMHLGAHMRGGTISVQGDASDWVGAEMRNGLIRISGDAGGQVGGGYRGSLLGMRGGTILVGGNAGLEVGLRMRRGMIVIGGVARDFAGLQMKGGTIVLRGGAEIRTGAWMQRGTIITLQPIQLMPTFHRGGEYLPTFIQVFSKRLAALGVDLPHQAAAGSYTRYTGDAAVPGKGEILVWHPATAID